MPVARFLRRAMAVAAMPEHGRDARGTLLCQPQGRRYKLLQALSAGISILALPDILIVHPPAGF